MNEPADQLTDWSRRDRLLKGLPRMVESGRVTAGEAKRLRTATEQDAFDEVVREIRVRHAGRSLGAAVADGSMSREEAKGIVDRLKSGEHSSSIGAHMPRRHAAPTPSGDPAPLGNTEGDA